jgi:enterochelin esterase-like enzyme
MDGEDDRKCALIATWTKTGLALALAVGMTMAAAAQGRRGAAPAGPPRAGTIERATVRERAVVVYLPPSQSGDAMRRFPVVYFLTDGPGDSLKLQEAGDKLARAQGFSEPIVVLANASTAGDSEKFVAEDLVAYMDGHYRTITARISRGLGGELSGGSVAFRIAMERPDVFSSLYLMSASIGDSPVASLQRYYAIGVEVGTKDAQLPANRQLHDAMTRSGIPHYYEEYEGAHTESLNNRIETRVLLFFSRNLAASANPTSPAVQ